MSCHDCGTTENIAARYEHGGREFYKCAACYEKDPTLRNFQACEVYSRIVGYMRPINQWNKGKQAEFGMRKGFKVK